MGKNYTVNVFSTKSIRQLKKELIKYRDSLEGKCMTFIKRLLDEGISAAQQNATGESGTFGTHKMYKYVSFTAEPVETSDGVVYGVMVGSGQDIKGTWYENDGSGHYTQVSDTINALLALEFGTAAQFIDPSSVFTKSDISVSRGKNGHQNDMGWYIITGLDDKGKPNEWKFATSIKPSQPMYKASLAIMEKIVTVAKEVFGE